LADEPGITRHELKKETKENRHKKDAAIAGESSMLGQAKTVIAAS
jgi:hypothetical protein